jgi:hypothetical protein
MFADLEVLIRNDAAQEPVIVAPATRRSDRSLPQCPHGATGCRCKHFGEAQRGKTMSRSYVRSSDDAMMIEVAPHQYVNRKVFHPRERLNDRHQREETAVEAEDASAKLAEAALI